MDSGNISETASRRRKCTGCVAVLMPYWDFWETSVPWDLRADRQSLLAEATEVVDRVCQVSISAALTGGGTADSLTSVLQQVDAIVIVSTMAVPSTTTMAVLEAATDVPVLVWALSRSPSLAPGFSHTDITTAGSSVGAPMVTSALARAGRRFDVVATSLVAPEAAERAIRRTVAAGQLLRGPLLAVGDPIPGYTTVVPSSEATVLPRRVHVTSDLLAGSAIRASESEVQRTVESVREEFVVDPRVSEPALERAARAELALRDIVRQHSAIAGTINCHETSLRGNPAFGIAPCMALGRLTSEGIPFTCTGDVLTAFAMAAVQRLGFPTLYHEVEALDFETDEVVLANSGEHDTGLCSGRPLLVPNNWYSHDAVVGPCALYSIPEGPASLVAFVMAPEPRFVVAEGTFTGNEFPATGVPNAGFRFRGAPLAEAWAAWARSGVTHHSAATSAHVAEDIRSVAHLIGAEFIQVS